MSISIALYTFSKRDNSTKQPDPEQNVPAIYTCILKDECGVINPTIIILNIGNPSIYNYAHIPKFNRFYWIREWTWVLGRWEAELYTDVLATYKNYIGNSEQYVVRSSSEYDGNITDSLYPTIAVDSTDSSPLGTPLAGNLANSTYVIGIINRHGGYGAVQYFALSASEFVNVCALMFASNPSWYDLSGIVKTTPADVTEIAFPTEVMKSLMNPMQYVVSCMLIPHAFTVPTNGTDSIDFGWWTPSPAQIGAKLGNSGAAYIEDNFTIPVHPQASNRGNFLNLPPYTRVLFNAGPFGMFPIDTTYFADTMAGTYRVGVDCITGEGTLAIRDDAGLRISIHRAQIGVPIKLAQITRDYLGTAANVIGTASSAVSGVGSTISEIAKGDIGGSIEKAASGVSSVTNGIVSSIKSAMPTLATGGSGGSLYEINRHWTITAQHFLLAEEDNANRGRPLAQKRIIKNIPGYIMVEDPDVETTGLGQETALIKQYMNGGFFYE